MTKYFQIKRFAVLLPFFTFLLLQTAQCQTPKADTSYYKGDLNVSNAQSLTLTLMIITDSDTSTVSMGSPFQTDAMTKASKSKITADSVKFNIKNAAIKVRLKRNDDANYLSGTFQQGLLFKEITFTKTDKLFTLNRPQTPVPPFAYKQKELTFTNPECAYIFHGTLTYPEKQGKYPAVVLVSGSGCQNRDEELAKHKPFMVIADWLTNNGIVVFRYDDRGFGSKDTMMYKGTTFDFASDARRAVELVKHQDMVDTSCVFVLGHSEGGMICQILAKNYSDIKGYILMASPAVDGRQIIASQTEAILKLNNADSVEILSEMKRIKSQTFDTNTLNGLWLDAFYKFNPKDYLPFMQSHVLVLQGGKDIQVIKEVNMPEMKRLLKNNKKTVEYRIYPSLNHLFQTCLTGDVSEYAQTEQTISPDVLKDITKFILKTSKRP